MARDYVSRLVVSEPGREPYAATVSLNNPLDVGPFRISQQGWDMDSPDRPEYVVLGVSTQPGLQYVWAGCILIGLSMPYAFYVKPLILRRRRRRLQRGKEGVAG
jgi:hypothetical protein